MINIYKNYNKYHILWWNIENISPKSKNMVEDSHYNFFSIFTLQFKAGQ